MSNIFEEVKNSLFPRMVEVLQELLPGGKVSGKEYLCASLEGGTGASCSTNLESGKGSDFATGESWGDVISLAAKVWDKHQFEAAQELAKQYDISTAAPKRAVVQPDHPDEFTLLLPVPDAAPAPLRLHNQYGNVSKLWAYRDAQGQILAYTARFDTPNGKVILPLCFGQKGSSCPRWYWKALPEPRPLYNLPALSAMPQESTILLVEGEKTADAAKSYFPYCVVLTWSGGANAISKTDFSPLWGRKVIIWPDNDAPGFTASLSIAALLEYKASSVSIVQPPSNLPDKWDLADPLPAGIVPQILLKSAVPVHVFREKMSPGIPQRVTLPTRLPLPSPDSEDIALKEWPHFSWKACPGILGEFVKLATYDSEADPAAICITALVRFGAEVYGYAPNKGPHVYVGETIHPPRLFAVICGNSSKARKGTSKHPVTKLFDRDFCNGADLHSLDLHLPARESGGPLSTGEGLAYHVRDESDEERERWQRMRPHERIREKGDKRLIIQDEEFASGLTCTKREGNTLSMGLRCFWDSGDYAPLTKNNPITVRGAHINIITHITMQELSLCLGDVQAFNGFGNRFLWICARRSKLVALPSRMPESQLAPLQRELWQLVAKAQRQGTMRMNGNALEMWRNIYPDLSQEHTGLAGCIINRAEAQTLRLALLYALLDGQECIGEAHLHAALAMWQFAQDSALYIFGDRAIDPLEEKVLTLLKQGPLTATELNAALNRNVPQKRLQPLLQQLEAQQRICFRKEKSGGRPTLIISLFDMNTKNEQNEFNEKTKGTG